MKNYKIRTSIGEDDLKVFDVKGENYDKEEEGITITVFRGTMPRRMFIPWGKVDFVEEII